MYRVLVADDERWIRKGIVKMIDGERLGICGIYEAESVKEGLSIFQLHRPHIVLSDVMFPAENGCDLCEQVFAISPETRIVMISAFDNFESARRSIRYQAVDYLLKPVSKEQLNQVLHQCIEQLKSPDIRRNIPLGMGSTKRETEEEKKREETSEERIEAIMKRMKTNLTEKYMLADLAAECCLSEVYFSNLFKKVSGMSPMNYLVRVRIEKACELISCTNWHMVKVARSVGYADYQYFTKVFKKETGRTPGEYRADFRKECGDG